MKPTLFLLTLGLLLAAQPLSAQSQAELKTKLADKIERVERLAKAPVLIDAVKQQNAEGLSLATIKQRDGEWAKGESLRQQLASSAAGEFLARMVAKNQAIYNEAFLTDNQGANIACSPDTSDYWQGDEEKWTASFASGKGEVFIGPVKMDESTKTEAVQISVPVMEGGKAIGVLVVGVKLSYIEGK